MIEGLIQKYQQWLEVPDKADLISLNEGNTPLIELPRLAKLISSKIKLYGKFEGLNPTGSFKDRGMTMAITMAKADGSHTVMCASTGNTSASAAAYAARAGMKCIVLIPGGKIALGKLTQALMHGAKVISIDGNFDEALNLVREICNSSPIALVNSVNPYRLQGQKTVAFEIVDDLGNSPDYHVMPVGNAGNITAAWMGYKEYYSSHKCNKLPKMVGFQASGAAPIVLGHVVEHPDTVATAIRIGNPASWKGALCARDESGGYIGSVTDAEILEMYQLLPSTEGVFVEPACAAPLAGIKKLAQTGYFDKQVSVVVTLTGHGLKDPDTAMELHSVITSSVPANREAVMEAIGLET